MNPLAASYRPSVLVGRAPSLTDAEAARQAVSEERAVESSRRLQSHCERRAWENRAEDLWLMDVIRQVMGVER